MSRPDNCAIVRPRWCRKSDDRNEEKRHGSEQTLSRHHRRRRTIGQSGNALPGRVHSEGFWQAYRRRRAWPFHHESVQCRHPAARGPCGRCAKGGRSNAADLGVPDRKRWNQHGNSRYALLAAITRRDRALHPDRLGQSSDGRAVVHSGLRQEQAGMPDGYCLLQCAIHLRQFRHDQARPLERAGSYHCFGL